MRLKVIEILGLRGPSMIWIGISGVLLKFMHPATYDNYKDRLVLRALGMVFSY